VIARALNALFALFFAWAAAMQLNDPDPFRWFAMYGIVALLAAACALGRTRKEVLRGAGVIALVWAATIAPELWSGWRPSDLGASMSGARPEVEYGREFVGLLIVATYCFVAARYAPRRTA
jgi:hypothetical protein